ncbi:hypothetical protein SLV14_002875 [Streptomyces sp. Je 1-4]|uniref:hypothetical protein n=1 Tax=Streptomyces TaxID=1883 RepID=UPI00140F0CCF|nr:MULTISPECIES: hypothetical protein [unclassified Streptomyces]QIK06874.1 hypothetical protein G7Z12_13265 [Streptomyces sp. ID38640]UYB40272.1 hypothetical protein SLV14_002875 [Streptomyces sp. Je 1-4]UZQ36373.1 hypothetical protein SLV14N_002875 [Streptomyces sp. Je 1-4] [Streptomyces sp. Je 1-4 4N24]UZQ43791.1 hypothetical protein SLV14NA_002875 [Streptomyces sp. Je 1-4] [Streptomyces sp. Je 1-4 4N24_ara]
MRTDFLSFSARGAEARGQRLVGSPRGQRLAGSSTRGPASKPLHPARPGIAMTV